MNNHYLTIACSAMLALGIAALAPTAQADAVEACTGPNGESGLQVNLTPLATTYTNCIHPCTSDSVVTVGTEIAIDGGAPVTECHEADAEPCTSESLVTIGSQLIVDGQDMLSTLGCHTVDECPLFESTGVIVDGQEFCFLPIISSCPAPYFPTPTYITGVPGYDNPLLLCAAVSILGCEEGTGTEITVRHNADEKFVPACV